MSYKSSLFEIVNGLAIKNQKELSQKTVIESKNFSHKNSQAPALAKDKAQQVALKYASREYGRRPVLDKPFAYGKVETL